MKRKYSLIVGLVISILFLLYPRIEFYKNNYLYMFTYAKDWSQSEDLNELEQDMCYDESYSYNKKRDISIKSWDYKSFWFFKWFKVEYIKGNICATEFQLEESYINNFLENAIIKESDNIDLGKLIKGKKAIVANRRYPWNDNYKWISYELDGKHQEMFISENRDGLIIIQVGLSDEGPKYIAYK